MSSFADRMKTFTDHLESSIRERGDALDRVHRATDDLLDGAREFMGEVVADRRAMGEELRASMADFHAELDRKCDELRHRHQEAHRQRRDDLHRMLHETNTARHEAVRGLKDAFQAAQRELSGDLSQASKAWHDFAARR